MTKRHFIDVANILDANTATLELVEDFADSFAEMNPRFDRARFIEAATINLRANMEREARILNVAIRGI